MTTPRPTFWDHFRPFLFGLCFRPILISPIVLILLIIYFDVGRNYGMADQLFHENFLEQCLAGMGVAVLLGQVCLIAYLIDGEEPWLVAIPGYPWDVAHRVDRQMRWYLTRTLLPLLALVSGACFLDLPDRLPFLVGLFFPPTIWFMTRIFAWIRGPMSFLHNIVKPVQAAQKRPRALEISLHILLAFIGITALSFVPHTNLPLLSFTLTTWIVSHGLVLFAFRLWRIPSEDERRMHMRAGFAFGTFYLLYELLFLVYWLDRSGTVSSRLAPPALVALLVLCLIVTVHGFLAYHFEKSYPFVVLGLVLIVALINGVPRYKLHFPGLDYSKRVDLMEADFEGVYAEVQTYHTHYKETGDENLIPPLLSAYQTMIQAHDNLQQRRRDRFALLGRKPQPVSSGSPLPEVSALKQALEKKQFSIAEQFYHRCRTSTDELSTGLSRMEYEALDTWKKQVTEKSGKKPKLVVVAVSGGATRSAVWTTYALDQLERQFAEKGIVFPKHVRVITGASGGMVGASYWVATLDQQQHKHIGSDVNAFVDPVAKDALTSLGQHAFFLDLPTLVLPGEFTADRGVALEQAWSKNLNGALDCTVHSLAKGELEGWRPSLIFSPMLVEDGRRLLISNLYIPFLTESAGPALTPDQEQRNPRKMKEGVAGAAYRPRPTGKSGRYDPTLSEKEVRRLFSDRYSLSAVEFFQLFPEAKDFKLSTAVRMSATFPYFSPAVDLPTSPRRRVVDAAYYDNYGVNIAASWIYHRRKWLAENTSGVVLIQLRDSSSEQRRLFPDDDPRFWDYARSIEWLTGPMVGAGSGLEAGMSFRNDELVQVLSEYFNRAGKTQFTTVVFESKQAIAMSWYLSQRDLGRMKTGFQRENDTKPVNLQTLEKLQQWWKEDHSRGEKK